MTFFDELGVAKALDLVTSPDGDPVLAGIVEKAWFAVKPAPHRAAFVAEIAKFSSSGSVPTLQELYPNLPVELQCQALLSDCAIPLEDVFPLNFAQVIVNLRIDGWTEQAPPRDQRRERSELVHQSAGAAGTKAVYRSNGNFVELTVDRPQHAAYTTAIARFMTELRHLLPGALLRAVFVREVSAESGGFLGELNLQPLADANGAARACGAYAAVWAVSKKQCREWGLLDGTRGHSTLNVSVYSSGHIKIRGQTSIVGMALAVVRLCNALSKHTFVPADFRIRGPVPHDLAWR